MCKIKLVRGALRVEGDGRSPFLGTARVKHEGPMTLKLRVRTTKGGSGKVRWKTADQDGFSERDQTVEFTLRAGADWQDVVVDLPVKGKTSIVRLYLPAHESPVEVQSIAYFPANSDRPVRTWDFATTEGTPR